VQENFSDLFVPGFGDPSFVDYFSHLACCCSKRPKNKELSHRRLSDKQNDEGKSQKEKERFVGVRGRIVL
jgi:hypothetical protein